MRVPGPRYLPVRLHLLSTLFVSLLLHSALLVQASYQGQIRGLVSDAMWSYQTPPLVFPRPAFEVWLPLPSFLAAIPMLLLGTGFHASQVSTVILGALVPVLTWRIAADLAVQAYLTASD